MSILLPRPPMSQAEDTGASEYLVSYGTSGAFGRFVTARPLGLRRGSRVVVETPRGLELGTVLCPASASHARQLKGQGPLLRPATPQDMSAADDWSELGHRLFDDCSALSHQLRLDAEIVDVEVLLEGRKAVVQFLGSAEIDLTSLVNALAERHELLVFFENAAAPAPAEEEEGGCGKPGCGRAEGGGGCTSCESGGCSSCGSGKVDMRAYFAHLRTQMENQRRVPLA
jgi:PSP1-like protein